MKKGYMALAVAIFLLVAAVAFARPWDMMTDRSFTPEQQRFFAETRDLRKEIHDTDERERVQVQEQIYGGQMMTSQEREEYRERMRAAKTAEEQEQIRSEHHERMKQRAKERGVMLPDEPPARGGGMGSGGGMMSPRGGRNR